jgi:hypothetical protein
VLEKRDALGGAGIVEAFGPLERAGALGWHVHGRGAAWPSVQLLRVDDEDAWSNLALQPRLLPPSSTPSPVEYLKRSPAFGGGWT